MMSNTFKPAYSAYGEPMRGSRPAAEQTGSKLASTSGPYLGRGSKCAGNDDTCNANKMRGQDYCVGHAKANAVIEVSNGD